MSEALLPRVAAATVIGARVLPPRMRARVHVSLEVTRCVCGETIAIAFAENVALHKPI